MQHKRTVLIIMRDRFLLELYKTIFNVKGFNPIGLLEEDEFIEQLKVSHPDLIVWERALTSKARQLLIQKINKENIPLLLLTKKEEACNIEKDLKKAIYDYGDIMNDNINDIFKRGEKLVEKWRQD